LLPNINATVVGFFGLQAFGRARDAEFHRGPGQYALGLRHGESPRS
jgi:hypothetical protein